MSIRERVTTGGRKEFVYTSDDRKRIESEDTESTAEFKEAYRKHLQSKNVFSRIFKPSSEHTVRHQKNKHWREYVGTREERYERPQFRKLRNWLNLRHNRPYTNWNAFLMNALKLVALGILALILYSNIKKLNEIVLWFIPLGGALLVVNIWFVVKYFAQIVKRLYYWFEGERNWVRYLIIILLILLLWHVYSNRASIFDPIVDFYDKLEFSEILPIGISSDIPEDSVFSTQGVARFKEKVVDTLSIQPIDKEWVDEFMLEVNLERSKLGFEPMKESPDLNAIAYSRFDTMLERPEISHYGAGRYNTGEVVFYPEGFSPKDYVKDIKKNAPLHWNLLVDPSFSYYGFYAEEGPTVEIIGSCPTTEIPGPNINVVNFFENRGCSTTMGTSTWLVIDLS